MPKRNKKFQQGLLNSLVTLVDVAILFVIIVLAVVPVDVTDILDLGTPALEFLGGLFFVAIRFKSWKEKLGW